MKDLAIVMGRNYTSRLCMIRSAGLAGCRVVVIQTGRNVTSVNPIDACSKYVIDVFVVEEPNEEDLLSTIMRCADYEGLKILLPTDDYTASVIDLNQEMLQHSFCMPNIKHAQGAIVQAMDKNRQKEIAKSVGLNVTDGVICKYENGHYQIPVGVIYPCFPKPLASYIRPLKGYMRKCQNRDELVALLDSFPQDYTSPILIEQYVEIEKEYGVLGVSVEGKSVIPAIIQKTSNYHGVTATGIVSPIDSKKELREKLCQFMEKFNFTGLFDIDMYENNGILYFNELNLRFGAGGFAVVKAAINLPQLLIEHFRGIDMKTEIVPHFTKQTFASDKVCYEKFKAFHWSLSEYKNIMNSVDFTFLNQEFDKGPYKAFEKENKTLIVYVRHFMKGILRKAHLSH